MLKLHGTKFQTSGKLARKKVEVRYDPEAMDLVEVWHKNAFQERIGPLDVQPHRRPATPVEPHTPADETTSDYLAHLVSQHEPVHDDDGVTRALAERQAQNDGVVDLLRDRVHSEVFDEDAIRDFLHRFGPFEPDRIAEALDFAIEVGGADQHVLTLLEGFVQTQDVS